MVENDPWATMQYEMHKQDPQSNKNPYSDPWDQMKVDVKPTEEPGWKSTIRTMMQPVQGFLATTAPGIAASFWQLLASGEANDPEEKERIRRISEEQGIPFDEEKWDKAYENALKYIPTVSNVAREVEEKTGAPLEPKTGIQKAIRFGTEATRLSPEGMTLRPLNVGLPKPVLGAGVLGAKEVLESMGVPEPFAEVLSFGILKQPTEGSPSISIGKKKGESGLTERQFENTSKPKEVSPKKIKQIEEKVEGEFRKIADKIIEKSPLEKTYTALKESSAFKEEAAEAFKEVSTLAKEIPDKFETAEVKRQIVKDFYKKGSKGITPSEYEIAHRGFLRKFIKNTQHGKMNTSQLVEQFRKNNEQQRQLYEPGKSFAYNQAKRDAITDYNRAISNLIEKKFPDTEFANLFKSSNERWSKIMDAEAISEFMDKMFEGKIDFKAGKEFFDKNGMTKPFERSLGKEGFKDFSQLMHDLMDKKQAHKFLKKAEIDGWAKLGKTAVAFVMHPVAGKAKLGYDIAKFGQRKLFEFVLDKPKYAVKWHKGIQDMKKGNFAKAESVFDEIKEAAEAPREAIKPSEILKEEKPKTEKKSETLEGKAEKIKPEEKEGLKGIEHVQKRIEEIKETQKTVENKKGESEKKSLEHKPKKKEKSELPHIPIIAEEKISSGPLKGAKLQIEHRKGIYPTIRLNGELINFPRIESPYQLGMDQLHELRQIKGFSYQKEANQKAKKILNKVKNQLENEKINHDKKLKQPKREQKISSIVKEIGETRGKGQQYHGTGQTFNEINPDHFGEGNIYGQGFYTTDAIDVAQGYSKGKKGDYSAKAPEIFKIDEKVPVKLVDMEKPISKDLKEFLDKSHYEEVEFALEEKPENLRELYDYLRQTSDKDTFHEIAFDIQDFLETKGYGGLKHEGGLQTDTKPHEVKIYFKPSEVLKLTPLKSSRQLNKGAKTPEKIELEHKPKEVETPKSLKKPEDSKSMTKEESDNLFGPNKAKKTIKSSNIKIEKPLKDPFKMAIEKSNKKALIDHEKYKRGYEKDLKKIQTLLKKEFTPSKRRTLEQKEHLMKDAIYQEESRIYEIQDRIKDLIKEEPKPIEDIIKEAKKEYREKKIDTPKKIEEKIEHAAEKPDITKKGLKTQKAFILDRIEDALANPTKYGKTIDLSVPGDGEFKIKNETKALEQFRKKVISAWPDKPLTEAYLKKLRR